MPDAEQRENADRYVDQKNQMPGKLIRQHPAEHRADHRSDDDGDRGQRKRRAALFLRKRIENDGLLGRLQAAAEKPLDGAEQKQLRE
jgi:hypothetical protein